MNPRDMTDEQLSRALADANARHLELVRQTSELRGRLLATFDGLATDRDVVDSLRAAAWAEHSPGARDHIRFDPSSHHFSGVPGGWPKGVNGDDYVRSRIAAPRDELLAQLDGKGPGDGGREQPSESVRALRALLGG
jgi:hypothetical protein